MWTPRTPRPQPLRPSLAPAAPLGKSLIRPVFRRGCWEEWGPHWLVCLFHRVVHTGCVLKHVASRYLTTTCPSGHSHLKKKKKSANIAGMKWRHKKHVLSIKAQGPESDMLSLKPIFEIFLTIGSWASELTLSVPHSKIIIKVLNIII